MTEQKDRLLRSLHEYHSTTKIPKRSKSIPAGGGYMSDADRVYLRTILEQDRTQRYPELPADKHFEVFTAEQLLKTYSLDSDDIDSGQVGKGNDGGVDSIYFLIDRKLIREVPSQDIYAQRRDIPFELIIIQSKRENGFGEQAIDKFQAMTNDLLNIGKNIDHLAKKYNARLFEIISRFRDTYFGLLNRHPSLIISFYYASQADAPNPIIEGKATLLRERVKELYSGATCNFYFISARKLVETFNTNPPTSSTLRSYKQFASSEFGNAYVCLIPLREFFCKLITTGDKDLRQDIFESNVRYYQEGARVNGDIANTLANYNAGEFWWLNNGITVLVSKINSSGDYITVDDPEVVNGLQTSFEIYNYFKATKGTEDRRNVLVRFIATTKAEERDRIIKATNNQTTIPQSSFYANDEVQRNIETYLPSVGLYYDRRKGYYRDKGIPVAKIVTIGYLSQALVAIVLQQPDDARARPTTVLERHHSNVFHIDFPPALYGKCALLMKRVDAYLRNLGTLDSGTESDIRFYLAMYASCAVLKTAKPNRSQIADIALQSVTDDLLKVCCEQVLALYRNLGGDDKVAKGPNLVKDLTKVLEEEVGHPTS